MLLLMKRENILKNLLSLAVILLVGSTAYAQGVKDIRFNEIVVSNTNGIENEMGNKCGWIEFRNSGYSTADLSGCHIVMVDNSGREYRCVIPRATKGATIGPQGYLIMFLDPSSDSPLTTNFTLEDAKEIYLYDASGKGDHLDKVVILKSMVEPNVSLSRVPMPLSSIDERLMESKIETRSTRLEPMKSQTPGYANYPAPKVSRAEKFSEVDKSGAGMTLVAMCVVFTALLLLFLTFREIGRILQNVEKKKESKKATTTTSAAPQGKPELNGEQLAAIALAIKMFNDELESREDMILTINRTAKVYSPWSSKIHGLTRVPTVRKN